MVLDSLPLCCFVLWNPGIVEDNSACVVLFDQMWLWEENGQGGRWVLVTSKYEQLFIHGEHEPTLPKGAMHGTHLESLPFLRTFCDPSGEKGHKTHRKALSFNPVWRSPSAWIIFPGATHQKAGFTNTPALNPSQEQAALWNLGSRVEGTWGDCWAAAGGSLAMLAGGRMSG